MPPDDQNPDGSPADDSDPVASAVAAVDAQLSQTPEAIRSTPEFRAVEQKLRSTARELGRSRVAEAAARTAAETARQAAEAERQAALESQLSGILGEDGIAAYQEIAELGATDPVGAARKFAELMASTAQSGGQPAGEPPAPPTAPGGSSVPVAPPPFPGGVDGNASLIPPAGEDIAAITGALDKRYTEIVERNQDRNTRSRVTMRERSDGFIAFLGSAYLKAIGRNG